MIQMRKYPNIAIIDDGINTYKAGIEKLEKDLVILPDLRIVERNPEEYVLSTHGTVCAGIVKKYGPTCRFNSIRVLDQNRQTGTAQLVKALEWCMENDIDIANVSLGSVLHSDYHLLKPVVEKIAQSRLMVVAACSNENKYTYPASMEGILGVRNRSISKVPEDIRKNRVADDNISYTENPDKKDGIDFVVSGWMQLESGYIPEACNSFAAAYMTSVVAGLMTEGYENHEDIYDRLKQGMASFICDVIPRNKTQDPCIAILGKDETLTDRYVDELYHCFVEDGYNCLAVSRNRRSDLYEEIKYEKCSMTEIMDIYDWDILLIGMNEQNCDREIMRECDIAIRVGKKDAVTLELSKTDFQGIELIREEEKDLRIKELYRNILELYERE